MQEKKQKDDRKHRCKGWQTASEAALHCEYIGCVFVALDRAGVDCVVSCSTRISSHSLVKVHTATGLSTAGVWSHNSISVVQDPPTIELSLYPLFSSGLVSLLPLVTSSTNSMEGRCAYIRAYVFVGAGACVCMCVYLATKMKRLWPYLYHWKEQ